MSPLTSIARMPAAVTASAAPRLASAPATIAATSVKITRTVPPLPALDASPVPTAIVSRATGSSQARYPAAGAGQVGEGPPHEPSTGQGVTRDLDRRVERPVRWGDEEGEQADPREPEGPRQPVHRLHASSIGARAVPARQPLG
jgi:hypothetical protein